MTTTRGEHLEKYPSSLLLEPVPGFQVSVMYCGQHGSRGLTTCIVDAQPGVRLPYHTHPTGEAIVVLEGAAWVDVQERRYRLERWDAIFVPAGIAHSLVSAHADRPMRLGTAFPTSTVTRQFVEDCYQVACYLTPVDNAPESLVRWDEAPSFSLADQTTSWQLFGRLGDTGVCGGIARFQPGSRLACHIHEFDESITVLEGQATCFVAGCQYQLAKLDTIGIPERRPHRFENQGPDPMLMLWIYASDVPSRTFVDDRLCRE